MAVPQTEEADPQEDDPLNWDKNDKETDDKEEPTKEEEESKEKKPTCFESFCYRININPHLVMLKVTLFTIYGATASLLPYLTIHMQSIGLTVEEIAVVYLALPLTTFLSPPVTGFLVDKLGHYKPVVVLTLILNAVFHHSLLLIPQMELPSVSPPAYVMRHPKNGIVDVWWSPCPSRECPDDDSSVDMILDDCFDHCKLWNQDSVPVKPLTTLLNEIHKTKPMRPPNFVAEKNKTHLKDEDIPGPGGPNDDLHFRPSGRKKPKNATSKSATANPVNKNRHVALPATTAVPDPADNESFFMLIDLHDNLKEAPTHLGMPVEQDAADIDFRDHFPRELLEAHGVNFTALLYEDLRCGGTVRATNLTHRTLHDLAKDCMLQRCSFREGGPEQCPPDYRESDDRTFWLYFLLRFLGTVMLSGGVTMMDPIALSLIQQHGGQFGRERLFSSVGMAIFSPLTGLLIDYSSQQAGYTDYSSAFYTYDVLLLISVITLMLMPVVNTSPSDHIVADLARLFKLPNVLAFIFFLFALGNFWGFIESFLFLYLKELGAASTLLGITVTVGTLSSIPFLWGAECITRRFGHVNVIVIAFFSQAVRLMGYSFIESAWWCFPFEAMESLALHLMWVAAATYCTILAPRTLLATLIGVLGMAHFSLGRGSGSFVGGLLIGTMGTRRAFRIMGLMSVGCGICYGLLHQLWLGRQNEEQVDDVDDDPEGARLNGTDEATRASLERLSLMIQFNQRGSLTSLDRGSRMDLHSADRRRQSSSSVRSSTSRMDLRRSTLEMNLQLVVRGSTPALNTARGTVSGKQVPPFVPRHRQRTLSIGALKPTESSLSIHEEAEEHSEDKTKPENEKA